jgi:hypothetical protein
MLRYIHIGILLLLAVAIAICLLLDVSYFVHGSMELFPTPEQQDLVSSITISLAVFLAVAEAVIVFRLWRLFRSSQKGSPARNA